MKLLNLISSLVPLYLLLFSSFPALSFTKTHKSPSQNILNVNKISHLSSLPIQISQNLHDSLHIALVLHSQNTLSAVPFDKISSDDIVCADANFIDSIEEIGWHQVSVNTNGDCGRLGSLFAAGWVEGYLSSPYMIQYSHDLNVIHKSEKHQFERLKPTYEEVYHNTVTKTEKNKSTGTPDEKTFWSSFELFLAQFEGILAGGLARDGDQALNLGDMLILNSNGEMRDIKKFFNKRQASPAAGLFLQKTWKNKARSPRDEGLSMAERIYKDYGTRNAREIWEKELLSSHCTVIVKLLKDNQDKIQDVLMAHGTWDDFKGMLKVMKKYDFKVPQEDPTQERFPYKILFPTYPGCLTSQDDYYVRDNGILLSETTLDIYNSQLFSDISLQDFVPSFFKLATSNYLADSAANWVKYFSLITTDVYSSQWMVLDIKNLERSIGQETLQPETFFVLEHIPGTVKSQDMSSHLSTETFWGSFNLPAFPEINKLTGNHALYGSSGLLQLSTQTSGRGRLIKELQGNVENIEDLKDLIRLNRAKESGGVKDPNEQIAPRLDLHQRGFEKDLYGETDAKVAGLELAKEVSLWGIGGPTRSGNTLDAFKFDNRVYAELEGIPKVWDYEWTLF